MLKPGGKLLYSTCTFSSVENEGLISFVLENFPQMRLLDIAPYDGFASGNPALGNHDEQLKKCVRIFPHRMEGEGHFLALMEKQGNLSPSQDLPKTKLDKTSKKLLENFFQNVLTSYDFQHIEVRGSNVYYLPDKDTSNLKGIKFLRNGLFLGELKKNRFEPSQPFAMALSSEDYAHTLNLSASDERISRYLKGETLLLTEEEIPKKNGWQLVCTDGFPLGWGKAVGNTLKNKYPSGWRQMY